jgi:hypothetical protein
VPGQAAGAGCFSCLHPACKSHTTTKHPRAAPNVVGSSIASVCSSGGRTDNTNAAHANLHCQHVGDPICKGPSVPNHGYVLPVCNPLCFPCPHRFFTAPLTNLTGVQCASISPAVWTLLQSTGSTSVTYPPNSQSSAVCNPVAVASIVGASVVVRFGASADANTFSSLITTNFDSLATQAGLPCNTQVAVSGKNMSRGACWPSCSTELCRVLLHVLFGSTALDPTNHKKLAACRCPSDTK